MRQLPPAKRHESLLVGMETSDDAGVFRLRPDLAIVQSVDYFTPVVDDPYLFGQIAATNAFSDIYAMGAEPATALNIIGFPVDDLPLWVMAEILRGGADKVEEAGATLVGGHSIDDVEPKFGLCVTGTVHPDEVIKNVGAEPGDVLVLTKPLGIGIITTAIKRGQCSAEAETEAVQAMNTLNDTAAQAARETGVHAMTDVTGFGLLGHGLEMAAGVDLEIEAAAVPVIEAAFEYAAADIVPGGSRRNLEYIQDRVRFGAEVSPVQRTVFADAITAGGLLIAVPEARADQLVNRLEELNTMAAAVIGRVIPGSGRITVQ